MKYCFRAVEKTQQARTCLYPCLSAINCLEVSKPTEGDEDSEPPLKRTKSQVAATLKARTFLLHSFRYAYGAQVCATSKGNGCLTERLPSCIRAYPCRPACQTVTSTCRHVTM